VDFGGLIYASDILLLSYFAEVTQCMPDILYRVFFGWLCCRSWLW